MGRFFAKFWRECFRCDLFVAPLLLTVIPGLASPIVAARAQVQTTSGVASEGQKGRPASMRVIQRLAHKNYVQGLAWNSDGSKLATLSDFGALVTIWDVGTWKKDREIRQYSAGYAGPGIGWTINGNLLTSAGAKTQNEGIYSLNLWDPLTGNLVKRIEGPLTATGASKHNQAYTIAVSKSGSLVAIILGHVQSRVTVFKAADWSIIRTIELEGVPPLKAGFATAITFAPNEDTIAIANGGNLQLIDLLDGRPALSIRAYEPIGNTTGPIVDSLAFNPDGKFLVSAPNFFQGSSDRNPVRIWDSSNGKLVLALPGVETTTRAIDWSADGARLAFVSDSQLQVWDTKDLKKAQLLSKADNVAGLSVGFSAAGLLAVTDNFSVLIFK
jgi:WD40 repeat protein